MSTANLPDIDVGLDSFAALSGGSEISNPRHLAWGNRRFDRTQLALQLFSNARIGRSRQT
jgi:hypothetical protein